MTPLEKFDATVARLCCVCGLPGARNYGTKAYCVNHAAAMLEGFKLTEREPIPYNAEMPDDYDGISADEPSSFDPIDLTDVVAGTAEQPLPTMLMRRGDGVSSYLFYPGVINGLHGTSGEGKGWVEILLLRERMALGETVMLIDLEDTPNSIVARLKLVGVPSEQILAQLVYLRPVDPFTPVEVERLAATIAERSITAVVIDSLGEAFGTEGINEDKDFEVGPWLKGVARKLAATGAAVLLIDHSTKTSDNPLHPSGSKRKRAAIGGASYLLEAVTPFVKGKGGRLKLTCAKDRHGTYRRGEHVAWLDMNVHPDDTVTLELIAPAGEMTAEDISELIGQQIVEVVADAGEPISLRRLRALVREANIKMSQTALDDAVEVLTHKGALTESVGPRNARLFSVPEVEEIAA